MAFYDLDDKTSSGDWFINFTTLTDGQQLPFCGGITFIKHSLLSGFKLVEFD